MVFVAQLGVERVNVAVIAGSAISSSTVSNGVLQLQINTASKIPIYRQLTEQIRSAIARGDLQPDEQLPSVRQLPKDVVVNPNTIARVYQELEREGMLVTRQGLGVFATNG